MKITTFNPSIVSNDAETVISLFEEMGFEKKHKKDVETNSMDVSTIRMKDAGGFHVDVTQLDNLQQDMTIIRMNVDNLDEAREILLKHGFVNMNPEKTVESPSHVSEFMVSPSGFAISIVKHIKDHD